MEDQKTRFLKLLLVLILAAIVVLAIPVAKGFGTALAVENGPGLEAQAVLARAHADELSAWKGVIESLPTALAQGGGMIIQVSLAIFVIALSVGLAGLLLAVARNFYVFGKIKEHQAQMGAYPNFASKDNLLSPQIRPLVASLGDGVDPLGDESFDDLGAALGTIGSDGKGNPAGRGGRYVLPPGGGKTTSRGKDHRPVRRKSGGVGDFLANLRRK